MMLFHGPEPRKVRGDYVQPPDHATEPGGWSAAKTKGKEHTRVAKREANGKCSDLHEVLIVICLMKCSACPEYPCSKKEGWVSGEGFGLLIWRLHVKNPVTTTMPRLGPSAIVSRFGQKVTAKWGNGKLNRVQVKWMNPHNSLHNEIIFFVWPIFSYSATAFKHPKHHFLYSC